MCSLLLCSVSCVASKDRTHQNRMSSVFVSGVICMTVCSHNGSLFARVKPKQLHVTRQLVLSQNRKKFICLFIYELGSVPVNVVTHKQMQCVAGKEQKAHFQSWSLVWVLNEMKTFKKNH